MRRFLALLLTFSMILSMVPPVFATEDDGNNTLPEEPSATSEEIIEETPEVTPVTMPEVIPEEKPEEMPEELPEIIPEEMPVTVTVRFDFGGIAAGIRVLNSDGEEQQNDSGVYTLPVGHYTFFASAEGYLDAEGSFDISDEDTSHTVSIELEPVQEPELLEEELVTEDSLNKTDASVKLSAQTLTDSMTIDGDAEFSSGVLNLNGYTLTVNGNFSHTGGSIYISNGTLNVQGDYTMAHPSYLSSSILNMSNEEGALIIGGNFKMTTDQSYTSRLSAGSMTVGGNFSVSQSSKFSASSTHQLTLTAEKPSIFLNDTSSINILHVPSHTVSWSGYYCSLNADSDPELTATVSATNEQFFSAALTLGHNLTIDGDVLFKTGTLDLNGHTLTVNGNLSHQSGRILVNNGTLNVLGNYLMKGPTNSNGTTIYSTGTLVMENEEDSVNIGNNFEMLTDSYSTTAPTAGTMTVGGNFSVSQVSKFLPTGTHELILTSGKPSIYLNDKSNINILHVPSRTVSWSGYYCNLNPDSDEALTVTVSATNEQFFSTALTLAQDLTIAGDMLLKTGTLDLNGHTLNVCGNLSQHSGKIVINNGTLHVLGDYLLKGPQASGGGTIYSTGSIVMENEADTVAIDGSFEMLTDSYATSAPTAGTMTVGGNFSVSQSSKFLPSGTHELILTSGKSSIYLNDKSNINILHVPSHTVFWSGYYCNLNPKSDSTLNVSFHSTNEYFFNATLKLEQNLTIDGNAIFKNGTLDLNGHTLTIDGTLRQPSGTINVNNGKLVVAGNYLLEGATDSSNGITAYSDGKLLMKDAKGSVRIDGDFQMLADSYATSQLTAGTMTVGGNFNVRNVSVFSASGTHELILTADTPSIYLNDKSTINILHIPSHAADWSGYYCNLNPKSDDILTVFVSPTNEQFLSLTITLVQNLTVNGDLLFKNGKLDLNGHTFTVNGTLTQASGDIAVNGGTMNVLGDYELNSGTTSDNLIIASSGRLYMNNENDTVTVGGKLRIYTDSFAPGEFTAGTLIVNGNFTVINSKFTASGTHKTILNGIDHQSISMQSPYKFNTLIVTKPLDNYSFTYQPCWNDLQTGNHVRLPDLSLMNFVLTVNENRNPPEEEKEKFLPAENAQIYMDGEWLGNTDADGNIVIPEVTGDLTITKLGYISRTLSAATLKENHVVNLQKESFSPVIHAVWVDNVDILRSTYPIRIDDEYEEFLIPEVYWGRDAQFSKLALVQEDIFIPLPTDGLAIQLNKKFDLSKEIYIVAENTRGYTAKKTLQVEYATASPLEGFSVKLGDKITITFPDSLRERIIVLPKKFDIDLGGLVPIEFAEKDGRIYGAVGLSIDASSKKNMGSKKWSTEVTNFCDSAKDLRNTLKDAKDSIDFYNKYTACMKKLGSKVSAMDGSLGFGCQFKLVGFIEGYQDKNNNFVLLDSGVVFDMGGSISYTQPFVAGPVPMFVTGTFSAELEAQMNLLLHQEIEQFTPSVELDAEVSLSGEVGVGLSKVASISGGITGAINENISLNDGKMTHLILKGSVSWFIKLRILIASFNWGDTIIESIWHEYPDPTEIPDNIYSASLPAYLCAENYTLDTGGQLPRMNAVYRSGGNVFASDVYGNASPQTVFFDDGTRLAVWLGVNNALSGTDSVNLYYSYYTGTWSEPQVVYADGTADASPVLRMADGKAVLIWQNMASPITGETTLADLNGKLKISGAVFDKENQTFAVSTVCEAGSVDTMPALCTDGTTAYAVWVRNEGGDWFGQNYENSILCSTLSESGWSTPSALQTGLSPVLSLDAAIIGGGLSIAYSLDMDCDLTTNEDIEVFQDGVQLSSNDYMDNGAVFCGGSLFWYSGGRLVHNGAEVLAEGTTIASDRFQAVDAYGTKAIVYAAEKEFDSALCAIYFDENLNAWGSPVVLYDGGVSIPQFSAQVAPDGQLGVLMNAQSLTGDPTNPYGTCNLIWHNAPRKGNVRLANVTYSASDYVAGGMFPMTLTVENTGGIGVKRLNVTVKNEAGTVLALQQVTEDLPSGSTKEIPVSFYVKDGSQETLFVEISAPDLNEQNRTDNTAEISMHWQDLSVENLYGNPTGDTTALIYASIANRSKQPIENITVTLHQDTPNGKVLQTKTIASLDPLKMEPVVFKLYSRPSRSYYVEVSADIHDSNFANNNAFWVFPEPAENWMPGDANDDGEVSMKDIVLLRKYIAYYNFDTETSSVEIGSGADVNGDSSINMKDVILLRKYFAFYNYDTGTSTITLGPQ